MSQWGRYCHVPHYMDQKTEARGVQAPCPRSDGSLVAEPGFDFWESSTELRDSLCSPNTEWTFVTSRFSLLAVMGLCLVSDFTEVPLELCTHFYLSHHPVFCPSALVDILSGTCFHFQASRVPRLASGIPGASAHPVHVTLFFNDLINTSHMPRLPLSFWFWDLVCLICLHFTIPTASAHLLPPTRV